MHSNTLENVPFPNCLIILNLPSITNPGINLIYPFSSRSYSSDVTVFIESSLLLLPPDDDDDDEDDVVDGFDDDPDVELLSEDDDVEDLSVFNFFVMI